MPDQTLWEFVGTVVHLASDGIVVESRGFRLALPSGDTIVITWDRVIGVPLSRMRWTGFCPAGGAHA